MSLSSITNQFREFLAPQHRLFVILQALGGLTAIVFLALRCFFDWFPHSGISVAIIAVLAAVMTLHEHMNKGHKALWIILIGAFLAIELFAITHEQKEDNEARKQQNDKFDAIATKVESAIKQSQIQFKATMVEAEKVFGKTRQAAEAATLASHEVVGGDSFAYLYFTDFHPHQAILIKNGFAPLYDLNVNISAFMACSKIFPKAIPDSNGKLISFSDRCTNTYIEGPISIGNLETGSVPAERLRNVSLDNLRGNPDLPSDLTEALFTAQFTARNGTWTEFEWIARSAGSNRYKLAVKVYKDIYNEEGARRGKKLIYREITPDFPSNVFKHFEPQ